MEQTQIQESMKYLFLKKIKKIQNLSISSEQKGKNLRNYFLFQFMIFLCLGIWATVEEHEHVICV